MRASVRAAQQAQPAATGTQRDMTSCFLSFPIIFLSLLSMRMFLLHAVFVPLTVRVWYTLGDGNGTGRASVGTNLAFLHDQ